MALIKDIARIIAAKHQLKQTDADHFVQMMVDVINEGLLRDRQVKIKGFGTFKLQVVKERTSVNVNTGERVVIGEHDKVTFTPDNVMRDIINKPFAQFETVVVDDNSPLLDGSFELENEDDVNTQETASVQSENTNATEPVIDVADAEVVVTPPIEEIQSEPLVENVSEPIMPQPDVEQPIVEQSIELQQPLNEAKEEVMVEEKAAEEIPQTIASEPQKVEEKAEEVAEPETTEEPTPVVEEEEEESPVIEDTQEYDEECRECELPGTRCRNIFIYYGILINIIVAIAFFIIGYFAGTNGWFEDKQEQPSTPQIVEKENSNAAKNAAKETSAKDGLDVEKNDTPATEQQVEQKEKAQPSAEQQPSAAEQVKKAAAETSQKTTPTDAEQKPLTQYDSDARVRTGGYYIMGTEVTVTVKEGQTLSSISKAYLGPDMECYVEAYNGVKTVKVGDKLKIPKLLNKKRLKK